MLLSKRQIDKCGDDFIENSNNPTNVSAVQEYRTFRLNCLTTSLRILTNAGLPPHVLVSARLKRLDSIYRKLTRENTNFKLGQLEDIIGLRVICRSMHEAQELDARLAKLPESYRVFDYTTPGTKTTGYRGIHRIMAFQQKLNKTTTISVRFEIQIRSFYQHKWAVWSEAHGEDMKLGVYMADAEMQESRDELICLSKQIEEWERKNPSTIQHSLAAHAGDVQLTLVWKQKNLTPVFEEFSNDVEKAVNHLTYLETKFPAERNNALLLVGVANPAQAMPVLIETHPLYVVGYVPPPDEWAQAIINS